MQIKVLGTGCKKCTQTEEIVKKAVEKTGADAEVIKVEDIQEIVSFGVFATPAVVVDGEVKLSGKVPSLADVTGWLNP